MKWICIMSSALAVAASVMTARAATISECPAPPRAVRVALPEGLPPAVRRAMGNDVALPGEPFDTTDVFVRGHKHSRYIFVWNIGNRWIIATERGGIALRAAVTVYDLGKEGKTGLIEERITFPESVCATATGLAER